MDLNLTEEQSELVDTARRFAQRRFPTDSVRKILAEPAPGRRLQAEFGKLGWPGLAVPAEAGGSGGGLVEMCLVVEELGRAGLPTPLASSVAFGALPVAGHGTAPQRERWLDGMVAGEVLATGGLLGSSSPNEWAGTDIRGRADDGAWTVHGVLQLVSYACEADMMLVEIDLERLGLATVLVDLDQPGVNRTPQRVIGGEPRGRIDLDGLVVDEADLLVRRCLTYHIDVATVLYAAHAIGACEAAVGLAAEHAVDRVQFGRPIGAFQAVAHRCADMRLFVDAARLLNLSAAWMLDRGDPSARCEVAAAKAYTNDTIRTVVTNAHQVHGAIGFSTEHDLHLFTTLAKSHELNFGTSRHRLAQVATHIGLAAAAPA